MNLITIFLMKDRGILNNIISRKKRNVILNSDLNRICKNINYTKTNNIVNLSYSEEYFSEVLDYLQNLLISEKKIGIKTYEEQDKEDITRNLNENDRVKFL